MRSTLRAAVVPRGRLSEGGALGFVPGVLIGAPAYRPQRLSRFVEALDVVFGDAEGAVARVLDDHVLEQALRCLLQPIRCPVEMLRQVRQGQRACLATAKFGHDESCELPQATSAEGWVVE